MSNKLSLGLKNANNLEGCWSSDDEYEQSDYKDLPDFLTNIKAKMLRDGYSKFRENLQINTECMLKCEEKSTFDQSVPLIDFMKMDTIKVEEPLGDWEMNEAIVGLIDVETRESDGSQKALQLLYSSFFDYYLNNTVSGVSIYKKLPCTYKRSWWIDQYKRKIFCRYDDENTSITGLDYWKTDSVKKEEPSKKEKTFLTDNEASTSSCRAKQKHKRLKDALKCHNCNYITISKNKLKKHLRMHKNPQQSATFRCDQCNYRTINRYSLKRHLLEHRDLEEITLKCELCTYQTIRRSNLDLHYRTHKKPEDVEELKCDHCAFKTSQKRYLKKHLLRHKSREEGETIMCNQCSFKTTHKEYLTKHLLRHKNVDEIARYRCDKCDYKTFRKNDLKTHYNRHRNPHELEWLKCEQCHYQTLRQGDLNRHLIRHKNPDEVRMFKCEYCNHRTTQKSSFKMHLLLHANPDEVESFKCDLCDYQTIIKRNFSRHFLRHK